MHCFIVVTVAMVTCLLCHRGQIVENVSIISWRVQSFKYIYCIHFEIKGRQKLEVDHPCVIISMHQSILGIIAKQEPFFIGCMGLILFWLPLTSVLYSTFSFYNPKRKLFTSGMVKMKVLDAIPTSSHPLMDTSCHELGNIQVPRTTLRTTFSCMSKIPQKNGATAGPGAQPAQ
ncbi:hypothetical protein EI555_002963 [Monodon monoceros]|uniref:1-acylglycerol-3-phosphate O-acyltransferase n=1 Tax=Monodon monoceros TaxID=40151 RepID=A0A4U1ERY2_MONMO|nr:hypothetical protein EI555_002963 [Monodon monoceros]